MMSSKKPSKFGKMSMPAKPDEMDLSDLQGDDESGEDPKEEASESPEMEASEDSEESSPEAMDALAKASDEDLMAEMEKRGLSADAGKKAPGEDDQEQYS